MTGNPADKRDNANFETTQWSEVLLAGSPNLSGARDALEQLCQKYWFPVYAAIRRRGSNHTDAEDLTQAFFTDLLTSEKLSVADPTRGRFRTFLLTACKNFVSNAHRYQNAQRRGGSHKIVSLEWNMAAGSSRYDALDAEHWTPEQLFDRRWALELIDLAAERVRREYTLRNQGEWFEALYPFIAPIGDPPSHAAVAEQVESSVGAVKTAVHRLRKRFGAALQEEVAETVQDRQEVKDEIRVLLDALAGN